jgi:hypothetical protein
LNQDRTSESCVRDKKVDKKKTVADVSDVKTVSDVMSVSDRTSLLVVAALCAAEQVIFVV